MPMRPSRWMLLGIVALVQTAILGWMVFERASLIGQGREVLLATEPIDPRSLFRGDYVTLSYAIANASVTPAEPLARPGEVWYATLQKGADGLWTRTALARERPAQFRPVANRGARRTERETDRQWCTACALSHPGAGVSRSGPACPPDQSAVMVTSPKALAPKPSVTRVPSPGVPRSMDW